MCKFRLEFLSYIIIIIKKARSFYIWGQICLNPIGLIGIREILKLGLGLRLYLGISCYDYIFFKWAWNYEIEDPKGIFKPPFDQNSG